VSSTHRCSRKGIRAAILAAILGGGVVVMVGSFMTMFRATKPWPFQPSQADPVTPLAQPLGTQATPPVLPPIEELISSRLEKEEPRFLEERKRMLIQDLMGRDITDVAVLRAMGRVPRQEFVRPEDVDLAYADHPLPIGYNQTISQPYIVALMTQLARPRPNSRALDVGTGSGYQAAVLAEICKEVYSIEIVQPLAESAAKRLADLGYTNITVRHGDGYRGWPEHAPFDVIIVAAAPDHIPQPLVDQLAPGGRLVIPVGRFFQQLMVVEKLPDGSVRHIPSIPVSFVPMTGEAEKMR
jgi:protein-L-isoaspartate(D-aspartate) O-methyltransferase